VVGSCEHGNKPSGLIKYIECDYLSGYQLLKNDSGPWSNIQVASTM
jgi:hypothetical protein